MMKLLAIDLLAISQLVLEHLRVTDDGIERRSQLVADIGEEHTFGRIGRIGVGARGIHLLNGCLQLGRHFVEGPGQVADFSGITLLVDAIGEVSGTEALHAAFHAR